MKDARGGETKLWSLEGPDALILDVDEVCKFFGIGSKKSLLRMVANHEFPCPVQHGGKLIWTGRDVAAHLVLMGRYTGASEAGEVESDDDI